MNVDTTELLAGFDALSAYLQANAARMESLPRLEQGADAETVNVWLRELLERLQEQGQNIPEPPATDGGLQEAIEELNEAVQDLPAIPTFNVPKLPRRVPRETSGLLLPMERFPAKITDQTGIKYSWEEVRIADTADHTTWEALTGGRTGDKGDATCAYEIMERENVPDNEIVEMRQLIAADGSPRYVFPFSSNGYLVIAETATSYTTVDVESGDWNATSTFLASDKGTNGARTERKRALIHSETTLGTAHGLPIKGLFIDLEQTIANYGFFEYFNVGTDAPGGVNLDLEIRAVTTDWTPATITYNRGAAAGAEEHSYHATTWTLHVEDVGGITLIGMSDAVPNYSPVQVAGFAGPMNEDFPAAWANIATCYGFEIRLLGAMDIGAPQADTDWSFYWYGIAGSRTFILLP